MKLILALSSLLMDAPLLSLTPCRQVALWLEHLLQGWPEPWSYAK